MSADLKFIANPHRTHVRSLLTPERLEQGYVVVLPGVDGVNFSDYSILKGLLGAGLPYGIEIYDWTLGALRLITNLRSSKLHREQSQQVVERITKYHECYPDRPIHIIGHSGGGGIALYSLANLPPEVKVNNTVLLGAAVSRHFDLRPSLKSISSCLYNFWSMGDLLVLGIFTCVTGSVDGCFGPCIGLTGIQRKGLSVEEAAKLVQVPYRLEYLKYGHLGGHFGHAARSFIQHRVAPLLSPDRILEVEGSTKREQCAQELKEMHPDSSTKEATSASSTSDL